MLEPKQKKELVEHLFRTHIISFPETSEATDSQPYSINLRLLSSYPDILRFVGHIFGAAIKNTEFNMIAGPYTDIPLATTISLEHGWPMIFVREERKGHGRERLIEGSFQAGENIVVIDDEIGDVASTLQLLGRLEGGGLKVVGVFVLLDRGYGALEAVRQKGYQCSALITLNDIFLELSQSGKIPETLNSKIKSFLERQRKEFLLRLKSQENSNVS